MATMIEDFTECMVQDCELEVDEDDLCRYHFDDALEAEYADLQNKIASSEG